MASQRQLSVCNSKKAFDTKAQAENWIRGTYESAWQIYKCDVCDGWHLTSGIVGRLNKRLMFDLQALKDSLIKPSKRRKPRRERFTRKLKSVPGECGSEE